MKQKQIDFTFPYKRKQYELVITENPAGLFFYSQSNRYYSTDESIEDLLDPDVIIAIYNHLITNKYADEDGNLK